MALEDGVDALGELAGRHVAGADGDHAALARVDQEKGRHGAHAEPLRPAARVGPGVRELGHGDAVERDGHHVEAVLGGEALEDGRLRLAEGAGRLVEVPDAPAPGGLAEPRLDELGEPITPGMKGGLGGRPLGARIELGVGPEHLLPGVGEALCALMDGEVQLEEGAQALGGGVHDGAGLGDLELLAEPAQRLAGVVGRKRRRGAFRRGGRLRRGLLRRLLGLLGLGRRILVPEPALGVAVEEAGRPLRRGGRRGRGARGARRRERQRRQRPEGPPPCPDPPLHSGSPFRMRSRTRSVSSACVGRTVASISAITSA